MQLAGRQHTAESAAGREVKDSVGKQGDTLISMDFGLEQHNYERLSLPVSFPLSFLTLSSPLQVVCELSSVRWTC